MNELESQDYITSKVKAATDILILKNPVGTAVGILCGFTLHGVVTVLASLWELFNVLRLSLIYYLAFGVLVFNIRFYLQQEKGMPKDVKNAFDLIQQQENSGSISHYKAKLLREAVIRKVLKDFSVTLEETGQIPQ